jgi:hypothetical protein
MDDFVFWKIMPDGTAEGFKNVTDGADFYGSIAGAIINGGVKATAFKIKVEPLFPYSPGVRVGEQPSGIRTRFICEAARDENGNLLQSGRGLILFEKVE